ncbi:MULTISPECIES: hypothetical protein [Acetobacter]|uniref:hypothetical protein n=1 Tax=Acetobacter TaxID=434 RepID=UPI00376FB6F7
MPRATASSSTTKSRRLTTKARSGAVILSAPGAKALSIPVERTILTSVARQAGPTRSMIENLGQALAETRNTGRSVRFSVEVTPEGAVRIVHPPENEGVTGTQEVKRAPGSGLARAKARGEALAARILAREDMVTAEELARRMGTTRVTVNARRHAHQLIGLEGATRGYRYPTWQLNHDGRPFATIPDLFAALGDSPWTLYRFLTQEHAELEGRTALAALQAGEETRVLSVAASIAEGTFA